MMFNITCKQLYSFGKSRSDYMKFFLTPLTLDIRSRILEIDVALQACRMLSNRLLFSMRTRRLNQEFLTTAKQAYTDILTCAKIELLRTDPKPPKIELRGLCAIKLFFQQQSLQDYSITEPLFFEDLESTDYLPTIQRWKHELKDVKKEFLFKM